MPSSQIKLHKIQFNKKFHMRSKPISHCILPSLEQKIVLKQQKSLNFVYNSRSHTLARNQFELLPAKYGSGQVRLQKSKSINLGSFKSMPSTGHKATDAYLNQLNNIRLVERILLIKGSKQLRKSFHKQFYCKHLQIKRNIGSNVEKKRLSVEKKERKRLSVEKKERKRLSVERKRLKTDMEMKWID